MATATEIERANGTITRIIGEGEEDGDELLEIISILHELHEFLQNAKRHGKTVEIKMSIV